ncbi:MAG: YlcI/YnfO family protein [Stenotrophobium sp.]
MKTATLPPLRVTPDLRHAAESVLQDGETLSSFVETSVRKQIDFRRVQKEFIARGLAAREEVKRTGITYSVEESMAALDAILQKHKPKSV